MPQASPKKSRRTLWLTGGLVVLLAAVGGAVAYKRSHEQKGIAVTTEKAVVRDITQVVTATGKIQPEVEVKITPEVYGEIVELPFEDGAAVKKGDLIVRIKPDLYQAQVKQEEAAVTAAQGASVHARANWEKAVSDLAQYEDLHNRHLVSDSDFITYKTNFDVAKADYDSAVAAVKQAQGLLDQARDSLSKTLIYSPLDGTVTSRSSQVGERVQSSTSFAGTEIMRVANLGHMELWVNVNEEDVPNVKVGDHVVISIDAYPDRKFNGTVKEIGSSAASAGATSGGTAAQATSSSGDEVTNFLVKIRVSDKDVKLRPGMSATADIETSTVQGVVAVPIQSVTVRSGGGLSADALQAKQAKDAQERGAAPLAASRQDARRARDLLQKVVFVRTADKVRLQPVEIGIADNTWIEIKRGVKAGEEVVSGSYAAISRNLKDGSAVRTDRSKKEAVEN